MLIIFGRLFTRGNYYDYLWSVCSWHLVRPTAEGSHLPLLHPRPVQHCDEVARLGRLAVVTECLAVVTECLAVVTECQCLCLWQRDVREIGHCDEVGDVWLKACLVWLWEMEEDFWGSGVISLNIKLSPEIEEDTKSACHKKSSHLLRKNMNRNLYATKNQVQSTWMTAFENWIEINTKWIYTIRK